MTQYEDLVKALGRLEIDVDGQPIPANELLLYLLCHPAGRTREQIGQALWRDASPAQVKTNLHVTLYQLRRTLGRPDWIVFAEGRYRVNPLFRVEFDALQFEVQVRAAQNKTALARALEHYRGDFLEKAAPGTWSHEPRERWRRLYAEGRRALQS